MVLILLVDYKTNFLPTLTCQPQSLDEASSFTALCFRSTQVWRIVCPLSTEIKYRQFDRGKWLPKPHRFHWWLFTLAFVWVENVTRIRKSRELCLGCRVCLYNYSKEHNAYGLNPSAFSLTSITRANSRGLSLMCVCVCVCVWNGRLSNLKKKIKFWNISNQCQSITLDFGDMDR